MKRRPATWLAQLRPYKSLDAARTAARETVRGVRSVRGPIAVAFYRCADGTRAVLLPDTMADRAYIRERLQDEGFLVLEIVQHADLFEYPDYYEVVP